LVQKRRSPPNAAAIGSRLLRAYRIGPPGYATANLPDRKMRYPDREKTIAMRPEITRDYSAVNDGQ
jgi:hypothetical protein